MGICLLLLGCSPPLPTEDDGDSQALPDIPADLPTEYEGVLYGGDYGVAPTQFRACDSGEVFELSFAGLEDVVWKGSCVGVYNRIRGQLDRSFDPPRLITEETLEARWCGEATDCATSCTPIFDSCYAEQEANDCQPVLDAGLHCSGDGQCKPRRFTATQSAGWMHHECQPPLGDGVDGDACEYPTEPGDVDTCAYGYRCWNPAGDLAAPGSCVRYCDTTGEFGPVCEGTCVQCSSSEWGLCMSECSGEDCNVDEFC